MSEIERKEALPAGNDSAPPAADTAADDSDFEIVVVDTPTSDPPADTLNSGADGVPGGDADGEQAEQGEQRPDQPRKLGKTARRIAKLQDAANHAGQAAAHYHQQAAALAQQVEAERRGRLQAEAARIEERSNFLRSYNERLQESKQYALNTGDAAKIAAVDAEIARTTAEMSFAMRDRASLAQQMPQRPPMPQQMPPQMVPQQRQAPPIRLHENVDAWREQQSDWLSDAGNQELAISIGRRVEARGLTPNTPDYWRAVNQQIRAVDPEYEPFDPTGSTQGQRSQARTAPPVGGVNRAPSGVSTSAQKRQVTLTRDQVAFCEKHGINPKSYARELSASQAAAAQPSGPKTVRF